MNSPDPAMPADFGVKYVFWIVCRWVFFNPLTILMALQSVLFQEALDYPGWRWAGTGASIFGMLIAQVRNRNKDYTAPIADQPKVIPK